MGSGLLCLSLCPAPTFHRLGPHVESNLSPRTHCSLRPHLSACVRNSGTAHTALKQVFQRDSKALGSDSRRCGC